MTTVCNCCNEVKGVIIGAGIGYALGCLLLIAYIEWNGRKDAAEYQAHIEAAMSARPQPKTIKRIEIKHD